MFKIVGLYILLVIVLVLAGMTIASDQGPVGTIGSSAYWIALACCAALFWRKRSRPKARKIRVRRVAKIRNVNEYKHHAGSKNATSQTKTARNQALSDI